jgi:hypothetical protein
VNANLQKKLSPVYLVANSDRRAYLKALLDASSDFEFSLPELDVDFEFLKDSFEKDLKSLRESIQYNILFELFYETLELLNALTQNSYFQCHSYQQLRQTMPQILLSTEVIMSRCMPLEKRTIILRLFLNLCVFPVKGDIPLNERRLNTSIPYDHLNGEIIQLIRNELKFIPLLGFNMENLKKSGIKQTTNGFSEQSVKYYLHSGLFPLIYKYCAGIYFNMTHDALIEVLLNSLITFEVRFYKSLVTGPNNFHLSVVTVSPDIAGLGEYKKLLGDPKSQVFRPLVRDEEAEETINPIMKPIRSLLEKILMNISFNCIQYCKENQLPYNLSRFWKDSALTYKADQRKISPIYQMIKPDCSSILALLKDRSKIDKKNEKSSEKTPLKKLINEYKSSKVAIFRTDNGLSDFLTALFKNKPDNLCRELVQKILKMAEEVDNPPDLLRNLTYTQHLFRIAISEKGLFILFALIDNLVLESDSYKKYMTPSEKGEMVEFHKSVVILMNGLVGLVVRLHLHG